MRQLFKPSVRQWAQQQLTTIGHPFSDTRFGARVLNPIVTAQDGRFLADWVIMPRTEPTVALHDLEAQLNDNNIVCIAVHSQAKRPAGRAFPGWWDDLRTGCTGDGMQDDGAAVPGPCLPRRRGRDDGHCRARARPSRGPGDRGCGLPIRNPLPLNFAIN